MHVNDNFVVLGRTREKMIFHDVMPINQNRFLFHVPFNESVVNCICVGTSGRGKTRRVFICKADTADITRLPSQSISILANAIKENCQFKMKLKS